MEPLKMLCVVVHLKLIFYMFISTWSKEFIYAEILEDEGCNTCIKLHEDDLDITTFSRPDHAALYYRYLTIEDGHLYSGALNHVFKFNLNNITTPIKEVELPPSASSLSLCSLMGKNESVDCQNHIRFIAYNTSSHQLVVCGTGSYIPRRYTLFRENLTLASGKNGEDGVGLCPFDPLDNATGVYVESNNPFNVSTIYAATVADVRKSLPVIYRPHLYKDGIRKLHFVSSERDNKWLNVPQFVASFDLEYEVLFFFREVALEHTNCGKKVYSRVARVCKSDLGNGTILRFKWMSFLKARLNCSIPGSYPYYFDEIQDVVTSDKETFFALFTTNNNGLTASAICAFSIDDINDAFNGRFKAQFTATSQWLPVSNSAIPPAIRSRNCATFNSSSYSESDQTFIRERTLMDKTVQLKYGRPIFYKANCLMQKLAVDKASDARPNSISSKVFYTATNRGEVYKIFVRLTLSGEPEFYISSNYVPFPNGDAIWAFKKHENYLYMGSDRTIKQMNTKTCSKYKEIDNCILDPDCAWSSASNCCVARTKDNLHFLSHENLTSISNIKKITQDISKIESLFEHSVEPIASGIPLTLPVKYKLCLRGPVTWEHQPNDSEPFKKVVLDSRHRVTRSHDNTLVINNVTTEHAGIYRAVDNLNNVVSNYTVNVLVTNEDLDREWVRAFRDWSEEFKEFKALRKKCAPSCCTPGQ